MTPKEVKRLEEQVEDLQKALGIERSEVDRYKALYRTQIDHGYDIHSTRNFHSDYSTLKAENKEREKERDEQQERAIRLDNNLADMREKRNRLEVENKRLREFVRDVAEHDTTSRDCCMTCLHEIIETAFALRKELEERK